MWKEATYTCRHSATTFRKFRSNDILPFIARIHSNPISLYCLIAKKSHTFSFQFGGNSRAGDVEPAADEIKHFDS